MEIPNILIVDDEAEIRDTIKNFIKVRLQCNIYEAANGQEAVEMLSNKPCDVMILDVRMPKKNGIQVLDKSVKLAKNLDTIVVTAWDSDLVAEECAKRNVECIPKPLMMNHLFDKITKLLKKQNKFIPL